MAGNKRWTEGQLVTLQDKYGKISMNDLIKLLDRSEDAIHKKASDLGIEFNPNGIVDLNTRLSSIEADLKAILKILNKNAKLL